MSETTTVPDVAPDRRPGPRSWPASRIVRLLAMLAAVVVLLVLPLYVEEFWLRTGFAVFAAIIGALGLNLLVGTTGQLSLAHAFFLAVGAVTYTYVSGAPGGTANAYGGLEWPPVLGMVLGGDRRGTRRGALQPDRCPAARDLSRYRLARAGLHRRPRAQHVDLGDRRLQRPPGADVLAVRVRLRRQRLPGAGRRRRAVRAGRAPVVPRPGPVRRGAAGSPRTWCARARAVRCRPCATARWPPR